MLTKFNDSNDMNAVASDAIHSYIKDGYRIDAKESVIDRDKDKDCTFKAVLKKDVDGIECKTVIKLTDNGDDKNKLCTYHKIDTVGDTNWHEETRTFSSSCAPDALKEIQDKINNYVAPLNKIWDDNDNWLADHRKRMKHISDKYGFGWDWFGDLVDDVLTHDDFNKHFKRLADVIKSPKDVNDNTDKKDTKWKCKCPSAYQRLDDYIKLNDSDDPDKGHIKVNAHDTVDDLYNKIVNKRNDGLNAACEANAKSDKKKVPIESLIDKRNEEDKLDAVVNKIKADAAANKKADDLPKQDPDDTVEDSLIKLVRYIFGK